MKKNLILGVGNLLLSDEGFGIKAIEYLRENYLWSEDTTLLDGGTQGLMLMAELLEHEFVAIIDIVLGGEAPGTTYLINGSELKKSLCLKQSMHQANLEDTLISCELVGHRPEVAVFGFEPYDYQKFWPELTPQAQEALPGFCAKMVRELAKKGIGVKPVSAE